jgi:hypothetical protein
VKVTLYAPAEYWGLTPEQRADITNGCGPGRFGSRVISDSLWGLDITEACNIHDFSYHIGWTIADKASADRAFLNNMLRIIDAAGGWWPIVALRRHAAVTYYRAVADFGGPAFWKGKNPAINEMEIII